MNSNTCHFFSNISGSVYYITRSQVQTRVFTFAKLEIQRYQFVQDRKIVFTRPIIRSGSYNNKRYTDAMYTIYKN